jgi:hypothetical protein
MKVEISDGEVVDKYSILCIKEERIHDETKKQNIMYEKNLLHEDAMRLITLHPVFYDLLLHVNRLIWDKTDQMKSMTVEQDAHAYASLSCEIFQLNDRRYRLKRIFQMTRSEGVKEEKSYPLHTCHVSLPYSVSFRSIAKLFFLVMEYDLIVIYHANQNASQWLPACFQFDSSPFPPASSVMVDNVHVAEEWMDIIWNHDRFLEGVHVNIQPHDAWSIV